MTTTRVLRRARRALAALGAAGLASLAPVALATEPGQLAERWAQTMNERRIDEWMALYAPQSSMTDLGREHADRDAIRRWGEYHMHTVEGRFTVLEARGDRRCVRWLANYRDRNFAAWFRIAQRIVDGRIEHIRIDWDRPEAPASRGCNPI